MTHQHHFNPSQDKLSYTEVKRLLELFTRLGEPWTYDARVDDGLLKKGWIRESFGSDVSSVYAPPEAKRTLLNPNEEVHPFWKKLTRWGSWRCMNGSEPKPGPIYREHTPREAMNKFARSLGALNWTVTENSGILMAKKPGPDPLEETLVILPLP